MSPDHTLYKMFNKTVVNPFITAAEFADQFHIRSNLHRNQSLRISSDSEQVVHQHLRNFIRKK